MAVVELKLVRKPESPTNGESTISEPSVAPVQAKKGPDPFAVLEKINGKGQDGILDTVHSIGAKAMRALIEGLQK